MSGAPGHAVVSRSYRGPSTPRPVATATGLVAQHLGPKRPQRGGQRILIPDVQHVAARRYGGDRELALFVGDRKVLAGQHDHHRAHLRMDIAEDVRHSFAVEVDRAAGSRLIEHEIETLTVEQGKHVVKPGIAVGKIYG